MQKTIFVLLLFFSIFSCQNKVDTKISKNDFNGKTFSFIFEKQENEVIIDFNDSTYQTLIGDRWKFDIPWRVKHHENLTFLVLENRVSTIKKTDATNFSLLHIGENDIPFKMSERRSKWNKKDIYGTWIEEVYIGKDSTDFPPLPAPPPGISKIKTWPPNYTISEDKILYKHFGATETEIKITNNAEFISVDFIDSNLYNYKKMLWNIKFLSDSIMIIDRDLIERYDASRYTIDGFREGKITLIKID